MNYVQYGSITETDPAGNIMGQLHPADYVVQVSANRQYEQRWYYGGTVKFIHSGYGQYSSSGAALDIGICYADTAHLLQVGLVMKNMGVNLKAYAGTAAGDCHSTWKRAFLKSWRMRPSTKTTALFTSSALT